MSKKVFNFTYNNRKKKHGNDERKKPQDKASDYTDGQEHKFQHQFQ